MSDRLAHLLLFREEDPEDSFVRFALAAEYAKLDRLEDARQEFQDLAESDPDYVGTYYHLGKLHERLGDVASACGVYRVGIDRASAVRDHHALAELRSALLEAEMGEP